MKKFIYLLYFFIASSVAIAISCSVFYLSSLSEIDLYSRLSIHTHAQKIRFLRDEDGLSALHQLYSNRLPFTVLMEKDINPYQIGVLFYGKQDAMDTMSSTITEGRFFLEEDFFAGHHYAVVGKNLSSQVYFASGNQWIAIDGIPFRVIGILDTGTNSPIDQCIYYNLDALSSPDLCYMSSLCKNIPDQTLPILVGADYADSLQIGDRIESLYIQKNISLEVVGILTPNSHITLYGYPLYLNRYIVMPSFVCSEPVDEADYIFQVRHYANKLAGFFPQEKAPEVFRVIEDLKSLQIGSFSFPTEGSLSGVYSQAIASIGISTHTLMILLIAVSLFLCPLLLFYLLNTNFQYIVFCYLAGICIKKLRWQTILSSAILFLLPFLLLFGYGKLTGLFVHPCVILLAFLWFLLSVVMIYKKLSANAILTYLGRNFND